jgi:hypothetical protein
MKRLILIAMVVLLSSSIALAQDICESDFDCNGAVDASDVSTFLEDFGRSQFFNPCPPCVPPMLIQKTGQTQCYDEIGAVIGCSGTGQDGEYQSGVVRFTDNGDGTVTDRLADLMWTKDVQQISGIMNWSNALLACNDLDYANYSDWKVPNVYELKGIQEYPFYNNIFTNVVNCTFWSSTTYEVTPSEAYGAIIPNSISISGFSKTVSELCVWCVRGGH